MHALADRHVPWLAYPATITLTLALFFTLTAAGQSVLVASYIAAFVGAGLVTWLELAFPERRDWTPGRKEVGQDLLFMVLVQVALAKLLGLAAVLGAASLTRTLDWPFQQIWPHSWPVPLQAVLMLFAADFLRYWLHVAAHRNPVLWRLHAIHHSPHRLYWLNVGRFHPIEKALQFMLDSLPFVLLGVAQEVFALYFVFYAVNGFFQHCNIKLRFGVLNYLVSSAELHRWHHSRLPAESNNNYGNNVIVWDLLFGTWFLPREQRVGELGLLNRRYPLGFMEQMVTPLTPDLHSREAPLQGWHDVLRRWLVWLRMQLVRVTRLTPLVRATRHPRRTQSKVLARLLAANSTTRFAKKHGLAGVATYEQFAKHVPPQDYELLRAYVQEQDRAGTASLTSERPVMYAVTSGTTGAPKYIPVLRSTLQQFRAEQQLYSLVLYRLCPGAFDGRGFAIVSPAVEGHMPSGAPFGSVSGYLYRAMPRLVRRNYVVPWPVYGIEDFELKYRVLLLLALGAPDITLMVGANPSSFLRLLDTLDQSRDVLAACLERGSAEPLGAIPRDAAAAIAPRLRPDRARASALRDLPADRKLAFADLWPHIRLLTVWTGGSCGIALEALRGALPPQTRIVELGYLSSELRVTTTVDPVTGAGVPTLRHNFFEFVERGAWEAGVQEFVRLDELEAGREYYVFVTTPAGLWRYAMNDIVRVVGRFGATPTLRFVQKGKGITSITGEKLSEFQVVKTLDDAAGERGFAPVFMMALADEVRSVYRVYVEPRVPAATDAAALAADLDRRLRGINVEYETKRKSGRLLPLECAWLRPGTGDAYRRFCVARGQREGQFKIIALQYRKDFAFPIEEHVVTTSRGAPA
jgi:sterol desaturase/sphingolipid hydroxylase (fatty acid hydroxylase superfamily)